MLLLAMMVMIVIALLRDLIRLLVTVLLWLFENRGLVAGVALAITAMLLAWTWKVSARGFEAVGRFSTRALKWSWAHRAWVACVLLLICITVLGILWARPGRAADVFG